MPMSVTYTTINGEIVSENRGGVIRDYVSDTNGNTVALLDESGNVTDTFTYWPFGEIQSHVGTSTTPFTFGGVLGCYSDSWGGIYMRAREYVPQLARWLTVDPLWPDQLPYAYAGNSPVTQTDPTGLGLGNGLPKPLQGCMSKGAQNLLLSMMGNSQCASAIKSACGGSSGLSALGKIPSWVTNQSSCNPKTNWSGACSINVPPHHRNPVRAGDPCVVQYVCISGDLCKGSGRFSGKPGLDKTLACVVLWELGNACACMNGGVPTNEAVAARVSQACGCGGSVYGGGRG
jgi:RHS repeat-associated protein